MEPEPKNLQSNTIELPLQGGIILAPGGASIKGEFKSPNFQVGVAGWKLDDQGNLEANDGTFRGALVANTLDIPDTTTANSFHVDANGNTWWGATTLAAATAKVLKDGTGYFASVNIKFGGTGADGALSITSGTTTINLGSAAVVVKNYTSISITSTGKLAFSSPHTNGSIIILKSQGALTLTSSTTPNIDASGMGAAGGAAGANDTDGSNGNNPNSNLVNSTDAYGRLSTKASSSQAGGAKGTSLPRIVSTAIAGKITQLTCGAGGGGAGGSSGTGAGAGGAGGNGGSALYIECGGAINFTSSGGISVAGAAGSNGTAGNNAGGGGGGGGGVCIVLYLSATATSGTVTSSGGAGGSGTSGSGATASGGGGGGASQSTDGSAGSAGSGVSTGGNGGAGGNGFSIVATNADFA